MRSRIVTWPLAIALTACSSTSGENGAGSSDAGAGGEGGDASSATANDWSCLGHVVLAPATKSTLSLKLEPADVVSSKDVPYVAVTVCAMSDEACSTPIATGVTDATGRAVLPVPVPPAGLSLYWIAAPSGALQNVNFINVPLTNDIQPEERFLWSQPEIDVVLSASASGVTWDTSKGFVGVQILDCKSGYDHQDDPPPIVPTASGVAITFDPPDPGATIGYILGDTVSTTATTTDSSGLAGIVNVTPGTVTVTAKVAATGQTIGTATVYAKAGIMTNTVLSPTP